MPVERNKPRQLDLFTDGTMSVRESRIAALHEAAEKAGCRDRLGKVLSATRIYSADFHPNLDRDLLDTLERSAKLDPSAFDAIVDALEFSAQEHKLPQALQVVPSEGRNLHEQIAIMRHLRRLGLPLTQETLSIKTKVLEGCDTGLTRYQPSGDNPGCMREIYYRMLAYNSAAAIPANTMTSERGEFKPIDMDWALLIYRSRPDAFHLIANNMPPAGTLTPPDNVKLDEFLLSLPKFTAEAVKGMNALGEPNMSREKKLGIWFSRVKSIGRPIREDKQGRFDFGE